MEKLRNGDWTLETLDILSPEKSAEDIFKQCEMILNIPLGAFIYDKNLGFPKQRFSTYSKGSSERAAIQYAQKSLNNVNGVRVKACNINSSNGNISSIVFTLEYDNNLKEVTIDFDNSNEP
ncbi:MAG: hypothetical protein K5917_00450 [Clostridiales bacterium]|nr:hypothetical protein [Clostridiales bacterium]